MRKRLVAVGAVLSLSSVLFAPDTVASSYPNKPVRMLVGFAPGGSVDVVSRLVAQKLSESFGHQFLVDNRSGAAGTIAADLVAKATADGQTLLVGTTAALVVKMHIDKLPYHPVKDFAPVALLVNQQNVLVLNRSVPATTVPQLVKLAQSHPRKLSFGSNGIGSSQHMSAELFMAMTGSRMVDVPYKGGTLAIAELVGGQIDMIFAVVPTALPLIQNGKLRALAVTSRQRSGMLPDVPTMQEAGLHNYEYGNWMGLLGPAGMPKDIVVTLSTAVQKMLSAQDLHTRLTDLGLEVAEPRSPEAFGEFMRDDIAKHAKLFRMIGKPAQ